MNKDKVRERAKIMLAWADGAKIQVLSSDGTWEDCNPAFLPNAKYRVKPIDCLQAESKRLQTEVERLRRSVKVRNARLLTGSQRIEELEAENERLRAWKRFVISKMHTNVDHFNDKPYRHWFAVLSKKLNPDKAIIEAMEAYDE